MKQYTMEEENTKNEHICHTRYEGKCVNVIISTLAPSQSIALERVHLRGAKQFLINTYSCNVTFG